MLEQFNELPKPSDLKSQLIPFQSHRMHLGTFTDVSSGHVFDWVGIPWYRLFRILPRV